VWTFASYAVPLLEHKDNFIFCLHVSLELWFDLYCLDLIPHLVGQAFQYLASQHLHVFHIMGHAGTGKFSLCHCVQTVSGAHLAS
jgi:hypothetical protein